MDFAIGKGKSVFPPWMRREVNCRLRVKCSDGSSAVGVSADWPSFGWLDKRPDVEPRQKLRDLLQLVQTAGSIYAAAPPFESVFTCWKYCHGRVLVVARENAAEDLCASFASSLIERALIDAVCRAQKKSFFQMVAENGFGFDPGALHPELKGVDLGAGLPGEAPTCFTIRHTVGLGAPITRADVEERLEDGEPESVEEYIERQGITCFKVKICGDAEADVGNLGRLWEVTKGCVDPKFTLDGNESYTDLEAFGEFVTSLEKEVPGLFQHLLYIEQPLPRAMTLDPTTAPGIKQLAERKPLLIDEADALIESFHIALEIGYTGVSHKNCKGVFKSLGNRALCQARRAAGVEAFQSAEDLTHMPLVSLQQDFAVVAVLGLEHAERNAHHHFLGLSHLQKAEKEAALAAHPEMYEERGGEVFLKIRGGKVECGSIQGPGFGSVAEPDWSSLETLEP